MVSINLSLTDSVSCNKAEEVGETGALRGLRLEVLDS